MEKKVTLAELVNSAIKYIKGQMSIEELNEIGERMTVRSYMPILDKMRIMMTIIFNADNMDVETHEVRVVAMEKDLFFYALLGGYCMVDVADNELVTYDTYDVLYPVFAPYILQFCEKDYEKLVSMIDRSMNLYGLKEVGSIFDNVDYDALRNAHIENEKLIQKLEDNKELIKELREVYAQSDPAVKETYLAIAKIANEQIRKAENGEENFVFADGVSE